jgi:hypothetical protein
LLHAEFNKPVHKLTIYGQHLAGQVTQLDALQKADCDEIFQDKITGISTSRPALDAMLSQLRSGDTVMTVGRCRSPLLSAGP